MASIKLDNIRVRIGLLLAAGIVAFAAVILWSLFGVSAYRNIRPYQESDRAELIAMLDKDWYWLVSEDAFDFSPDYMFGHRASTFHYADNSLTIMVYEEDHKPAGFVTYHLLDGYTGRIQFLAVGQEYRKKGYGKLLLEYAVNDLKKRGVCFVHLAVRDNNQAAKKLYEQLGFQVTGSSKGFLFLTKDFCHQPMAAAESY